MVVNCPGCGIALNVPDEAKGRQVRCTGCGHVFAVPVDGAAPANAAAPQPAAPFPQYQPGPPAFQGATGAYQPEYGDEVYQEGFNLQSVNPTLRAYWGSWRPESFSTSGAVLLDIFTCGIFGLIYYGLKFGELPKASRNDFGAGKAIGFSFIPYFNFYWIFRFWYGLCDRINMQIRLRGRNDMLLSRSMVTAICVMQVCSAIPYVNLLVLIPYMIVREIFVGRMQNAINTMAAPTMAMPGQEAQAWR